MSTRCRREPASQSIVRLDECRQRREAAERAKLKKAASVKHEPPATGSPGMRPPETAGFSQFRTILKWLQTAWGKIATVLTALAGCLAWLTLRPSFEISQSVRLRADDPFSQTFEVKNTSVYDIKNVYGLGFLVGNARSSMQLYWEFAFQ